MVSIMSLVLAYTHIFLTIVCTLHPAQIVVPTRGEVLLECPEDSHAIHFLL